MNPLTEEWVIKAESDRATGERGVASINRAEFRRSVFSLAAMRREIFQGLLHEAKIPFPRTHDLSDLLNLLLPTKPSWRRLRADLQEVNYLCNRLSIPWLDGQQEGRSEGACRLSTHPANL
jgi:hypothetical protein